MFCLQELTDNLSVTENGLVSGVDRVLKSSIVMIHDYLDNWGILSRSKLKYMYFRKLFCLLFLSLSEVKSIIFSLLSYKFTYNLTTHDAVNILFFRNFP